MSFNAKEISRYSGAPVELYRFAYGPTLYLFTSGDKPVTYNGYEYDPESIERGEIEQSQEDQAGALEITMPRINPLAALFIPYLPSENVMLTIYRFHRSDAETVVMYIGKIVSVNFTGAEAQFTVAPINETLRKRVPGQLYQSQCNHALYSTGCGIDKAAFRVSATISSHVGSTLVSAAFATKPDGWFTNGWVQKSNGNVRWIVNHVGNTLTLMNPFTDIAGGETVDAYAGCDRTEAACRDKFSNLNNYLGFTRIPGRNPFNGAITYK